MTSYTFEHIHLRSPDPEATATWFERMFQARITRSTVAGSPRVDVHLGGMDIFIAPTKDDVAPAPAHPHQGLDHFGLRVPDLDAAIADLKAKGANFTMEATNLRPGLRIAFLLGPQDVSIELLQRD
jgi:catechol 2,3-dioxygenase-like lactoylglutathione lyase family enzyme